MDPPVWILELSLSKGTAWEKHNSKLEHAIQAGQSLDTFGNYYTLVLYMDSGGKRSQRRIINCGRDRTASLSRFCSLSTLLDCPPRIDRCDFQLFFEDGPRRRRRCRLPSSNAIKYSVSMISSLGLNSGLKNQS